MVRAGLVVCASGNAECFTDNDTTEGHIALTERGECGRTEPNGGLFFTFLANEKAWAIFQMNDG